MTTAILYILLVHGIPVDTFSSLARCYQYGAQEWNSSSIRCAPTGTL